MSADQKSVIQQFLSTHRRPFFAAEVSKAHLTHYKTLKYPLPAMVALVNLTESKTTGRQVSPNACERSSYFVNGCGKPCPMWVVPSPSWDPALY